MLEIDASLSSDEVSIPSRPMAAIMSIGKKFQIPIPIANGSMKLPPDLERYAPLSKSILKWYEDNYGDRLKIDWSSGSIVVRLDGDLYRLTLPRIFGAAEFFVDRAFSSTQKTGKNGHARCNVVQLIVDITPAKAARLSDDALHSLWKDFLAGLAAVSIVEATASENMMGMAQGDIETAVSKLMERRPRSGDSKWASLQAAEKVIKTAITLQGAKFARTHSLSELSQQLENCGISAGLDGVLASIQCSPRIRYGDEPCTPIEALEAHRASLQVVLRCFQAGAKFKAGLG